MKLKALLTGVDYELRGGSSSSNEIEIREVTHDSRAVQPGDLFVALSGQAVDGHRFVHAAVLAGAVASVVEKSAGVNDSGGLLICVDSTRRALATIAANRFGHPADKLCLIGITGTNGKTTTNFLVESILARAKLKVGLFGTVLYRYGDTILPSPNTTPLPLELHQDLALMQAAGVSHVTMECSSHALALDRLEGLKFDVAAFTNLTQDHLDFHGTMDEYRATKQRLFLDHLDRPGTAVVLVDSAEGEQFANLRPAQTLRVSASRETSKRAAIYPKEWTQDVSGTRAIFETPNGELIVRSPLVGGYNLENIVVAIGIASALKMDLQFIAAGLAHLRGVPGRLERVDDERENRAAIFVDYAHTPDALERVLQTLRAITVGRLITVFGCGGDRDNSKRPLMGRAAAAASDLAIVTSDNPRTEDPDRIIAMVEAGVRSEGLNKMVSTSGWNGEKCYMVESDRRQAIARAVEIARPGDTLLIAGKGHEDYQIIGTTKVPFDDRVVARTALANLESKS